MLLQKSMGHMKIICDNISAYKALGTYLNNGESNGS